MRRDSAVWLVCLVVGSSGCIGADDSWQPGRPGFGHRFHHAFPESDAGTEDGGSEDAGNPLASLSVQVTSPTQNAVLSGVVTIAGTTTGQVTSVELGVNDVTMAAASPSVSASGHAFTLSLDTTRLPNGAQTLDVTAAGNDGTQARAFVPVWVDNQPAIVGHWRVIHSTQSFPDCELYFFPSGAVRDGCGLVGNGTTWTLETATVISVQNGNGTLVGRIVAISADGQQLKLKVDGGATLTLRLVEQLDPLRSDAGAP